MNHVTLDVLGLKSASLNSSYTFMQNRTLILTIWSQTRCVILNIHSFFANGIIMIWQIERLELSMFQNKKLDVLIILSHFLTRGLTLMSFNTA